MADAVDEAGVPAIVPATVNDVGVAAVTVNTPLYAANVAPDMLTLFPTAKLFLPVYVVTAAGV